MRLGLKAILAVFCVGVAGFLDCAAVRAQVFVPTISLKSGESADLLDVYWAVNCRSVLKGTPEVEIVDGPPAITVSVREGMVLPRILNCAKPVQGGTVVLTAPKEIDDASNTRLTLRIKYKGKDGNRQSSVVYNLALFP